MSPCPRLLQLIYRCGFYPILLLDGVLLDSVLLNTFALAIDLAFPWGRSIGKARVEGLQNGIPGQPGSVYAHMLLERDFKVGFE